MAESERPHDPTREQYEQFLQEYLGPDVVVRAVDDKLTTIEAVDRESRPKCDFCGAMPGEYVFPAENVRIAHDRMGDHISHGGWGACADCRRLVEAGDRNALAARSARVIASRMGISSATALPGVKLAHAAFWKARKKR